MTTIYKFNPEHKNYEGTMEARLDPLMGQPLLPSPHHASRTLIPPPPEEPDKIRCFDHDTQSWVQKENWLGKTVYKKSTGRAVQLKKLRSAYKTYGPLDDRFTGQAPPDKFYDWDEQSQSWVNNQADRDEQDNFKAKIVDYRTDTERNNVWDKIQTMSKAEFVDWFDNQVTDLASAKVALRAIALQVAKMKLELERVPTR